MSARVASWWLMGLLAVVLAGLSGFAAFGSWRQAAIVSELAEHSASTDAYQEAAYLVSWEMSLIQASLTEPHGEERWQLAAVHTQAQGAMERMAVADSDHPRAAAGLVEAHRSLKLEVATYLRAIDLDDMETAEATLEWTIEPAAKSIMSAVLAERRQHLDSHTAHQSAGQRESRRLLWGSAMAFTASLLGLVLFACLARVHRRHAQTAAATDPLTALPNRVAFTARTGRAIVEEASHRARRGQTRRGRVTVLVVDLDGFRHVNDRLGPGIGDLLLTQVGWRLQAAVREQDLVARVGNDEFAVLLRDAEPAIGEAIAARLSGAFGDPFMLDELTIDLKVSIGAATAAPGDDVPTLLRDAGTAMRQAKQQRLGFRRYTGTNSDARLTLVSDLRRA